jgi:phospho-N-acetylmuramoyl-pentapeptide-transferase
LNPELNFPENAKLALIPVIAAFVVSAAIYPLYIRWLQSRRIGQYIREEGPQSHAVKAKTPTMGGLCFIFVSTAVSVVYLFVLREYNIGAFISGPHTLRAALIVIGIAALCGLVGFADDYGKVTSKSNRGLSAKLRLIIEFILGAVLALLLAQPFVAGLPGPEAFLPFLKVSLPAPLLYLFLLAVPMSAFMVAATTNSINVHDGMDGLSAGTSIMVFAVLMVMLLVSGQTVLACVPASMVGALIGFLIYNRYPARIFMGDTGSLYIGGLMAALVVAGGLIYWFVPLALIYIAETLSVLLQVSYFKLTKDYIPEKPMSKPALIWLKLTKRLPGEGKRLFRMAPLHHHFEALAQDKGIPEWRVVAYFWGVQFVLCATVLIAFFAIHKNGSGT